MQPFPSTNPEDLARSVRRIFDDATLTPEEKSQALHGLDIGFHAEVEPQASEFEQWADRHPLGDAAKAWAADQKTWSACSLLRDFSASQLDHGYRCSNCGLHFTLKTRELDDKKLRRYNFHGCHERKTCPFCSIDYGRTKGEENYRAMRNLFANRKDPLEEGDVISWHLTLTLLKSISRSLMAKVDEGELSPKIAKIRAKGIELAARYLFKVRRADLMATSCSHFTSSSNPLDPGGHVHNHNTFPNCTPDGRPLTNYRELPLDRFREFKHHYYDYLCKLLPEQMRDWAEEMAPRLEEGEHVSNRLDIHLEFVQYQADGSGWRQLRHHCLYESRHMFQDLVDHALDCQEKERDFWNRTEDLRRFFKRAEFLQPKKTRVHYGMLASGQRRHLNIFEAPKPEEPLWHEPANSYRELERFTDSGAFFKEHIGGDWYNLEKADIKEISLHDRSKEKFYINPYGMEGLDIDPVVAKVRLQVGRKSRRKKQRDKLDRSQVISSYMSNWEDLAYQPDFAMPLVSPALARDLEKVMGFRLPGEIVEKGLSGYSAAWLYDNSTLPLRTTSYGPEPPDIEEAERWRSIPRIKHHLELHGHASSPLN